jgi:hypothetical protein
MRNAILILLIGLVGGCALWYFVAFRAWARLLNQPEVAKLNQKKREAFMKSAEYRLRRNQVRFAMYSTTLLLAGIYLIMRLPA